MTDLHDDDFDDPSADAAGRLAHGFGRGRFEVDRTPVRQKRPQLAEPGDGVGDVLDDVPRDQQAAIVVRPRNLNSGVLRVEAFDGPRSRGAQAIEEPAVAGADLRDEALAESEAFHKTGGEFVGEGDERGRVLQRVVVRRVVPHAGGLKGAVDPEARNIGVGRKFDAAERRGDRVVAGGIPAMDLDGKVGQTR